MTTLPYSIQIELASDEHVQWIQDFCNLYSEYLEISIQENNEYYRKGYRITLNGDNYAIIKQVANYICTKIGSITHIENCVFWSFGIKYWISYVKRIINLISHEITNDIWKVIYTTAKKHFENRQIKSDI